MNQDIQTQVEAIIGELTLQEKASFCSGKDNWHLEGLERLNIPEIMVADGPHGLRKQEDAGDHAGLSGSIPSTCFPTAVGLAATWNRELLQQVGAALGEECRQEGISVLLGPGMNIKRSPLCGRNFEYYSEDPYLTGELAAALIKGVQSQGVGTSVKHFAANNQEKKRMKINALIDQRTLHEIYLAGFEKAVKQARPWTVMAAYNKVNNVFASENKELLDTTLRKKWGFDGVVMSDWGAVNDRVLALQAGLDLEMPSSGGVNDRLLAEAVQNGKLDTDVLDTAVRRLLTLILKAAVNNKKGFVYDKEAHHQLAQKAAAESMVLLKNKNQVLPIAPTAKVALIGALAREPRYQGAGSSLVNPLRLENAFDIAQKRLSERLLYAPGYQRHTDIEDEKLLNEAKAAAQQADVVVIMAGLTEEYESEGFDRTHLQLPNSHNRLINEMTRIHNKVVVVLNNGAPVMMPWLHNVSAVVEAYLPGQAGGSAVWDVLLGDANPSGRLAESFPAEENDYAASLYFPMGPNSVEYRESVYVGYRFYDSADVQPLFPFGYGLSYTSFSYSNLLLSKEQIDESEELKVTVTVENTGAAAGMEVVQIYVKDKDAAVFRPEKELKEFAKIRLEPGEKQDVTFTLDRSAFAFYDVNDQDWRVESGEFLILAGSSSRDIHCQKQVYVTAAAPRTDSKNSPDGYFRPAKHWQVPQEEYMQLLNRNVPADHHVKPYHRNSTVEEIRHNLIGRILYRKVLKEAGKMAGPNEVQLRMMQAVILEMPLRGLVMMSRGALSFQKLDGLIDLMNGKFVNGLNQLWKSRKNS